MPRAADVIGLHATWEGDESDLRRVDPETGEVLEHLDMPRGVHVSGLESDGADHFFCGGEKTGMQESDANYPLSLLGDAVNSVQDQIKALANFTKPAIY